MALTNADFRSLLNSTDLSVMAQLQSEKKRKKTARVSDNDDRKEKRKLRYVQLQKKKNEKEHADAEEEELSKYRDRANERRKCDDAYYQRVAEELREMKDRSIAESKYLGGDVKHTHLVKGLDFALLTKVRSELQNSEALKQNEMEKNIGNGMQQKKEPPINSAFAQKLHKSLFLEPHPHHLSYRDKLKRIETTLMRGARFKGNTESFLPGRTCYLFDTNMAMVDDIPTVLFNSKEDCALPKDGMVTYLHSKIASELVEALQWHSQNRKKKRNERQPRRLTGNEVSVSQNQKLRNKADGVSSANQKDDEDIFEGIGSFEPDSVALEALNKRDGESVSNSCSMADAVQTEGKGNNTAALKPKMDIIRDEQGMDVDEDEYGSAVPYSAEPYGQNSANAIPITTAAYGMEVCDYADAYGVTQGVPSSSVTLDSSATPFVLLDLKRPTKSGMTTKEQDKGFHSVYKRDEEALRKRGDEDEREKDPAYVSDTYMECYPGFGGDVAYEVFDSDEEEDRSKMDMGRLKQFGAKRREDFARREDWEQYQLRKEALPKAAFQYGRKMDDNRITRRKKKLNPDEEWRKIEKMLGDKREKEDAE